MQHEITEKTPLLDGRGRLCEPGYARSMRFDYNRSAVRAGALSLKEWDFYQMIEGDMLFQITIGHVSYVASFSATLLNLSTGERRVFTRMRPLPLRSLPMPENPETPNELTVRGKDFTMRFVTDGQERRLSLSGPDVEIDAMFETDPDNEKMVIATPFEKPRQFYLNYKENFYLGRGRVRIGDMAHTFTGACGLLDWGRGVWPFRHEWYWGSGAGVVERRRFGFNLGWGFGNLAQATENMYFIDGRAVKLGALTVTNDEPRDRMRPWRFTAENGLFDLTLTPRFDNFTETNFGVIHTKCHQLFGSFDGSVALPEGGRLTVSGLPAFCEHAVNRW